MGHQPSGHPGHGHGGPAPAGHGHGGHPGGAKLPRIPVGSARGKRANIASFILVIVGGLAQGWALICVGRGLGALMSLGPATAAGDWKDLAWIGVGSGILAAVCQGLAELVARLSATHEEGAIRARALRHLLWLGPGRASKERSGAHVSMLTDGAERVALYRQTFLAPTVAAAVSPALVLVLMGVVIDWLTALILLVAVIVIPPFILRVHKKVRRSSSGSRQARTRLSAEYLDAIQGLTTLSLNRAADRRLIELRKEGERNRLAVMRLLAGNQLVIFLTDSLFSLFFVTAAGVLALVRLSAGAISVGDALAIVLLAYVLLEPLDHVGAFFYVAMGGLANQRAIRRLLLTRRAGGQYAETAQVPSAATGARVPHGTAEAGPGQSDAGQSGGCAGNGVAVRLHGVSARWEQGAPEVLTDITMDVAAGEHVAVVGPSGAGKSTLVALLAGDLPAERGTVRVGGVQAGAVSLDEVRKQSAVVAQSTWLFTGTIASNLRLAAPQASEEQLWQALAAANLAEEVRAMPHGLDTAVGEGGLGLSGGQAQRLSLARAFLSGRPLLILDEPTSQVDLESEALIAGAIERIGRDRTVITISHREGAIVGADRVLRVENGQVMEVAA